jgi:hypothetical protein
VTWFKVDDGFAFHPKAIMAGNAALGLWVRAGAWCGANLTDGALPKHMIGTFGAQKRDARKLVEVGLWVETKDGYQFHEWGQMQPSKAEVLAERAANAKRQKAWRDRQRNGVTNDVTNDVTDGATNGAPTRPDPTLKEKAFKRSSSPATPDDAETVEPDPKPIMYSRAFEAFWDAYPRKVGKKASSAAFDKARKAASLQTICQAAARYRDDPNREDAYTAHPTTWLNEGRWDDQTPLPNRMAAQTKPSGSQVRAQAGIARLAAYDNQQQQMPYQRELGA